VRVDGEELLSSAATTILAWRTIPRLIDAACHGAREFGVGAGASHLVTGHTARAPRTGNRAGGVHRLAGGLAFLHRLTWPTSARLPALLGHGDEIFADKLNHASLNDAAVLSRARLARYPTAT